MAVLSPMRRRKIQQARNRVYLVARRQICETLDELQAATPGSLWKDIEAGVLRDAIGRLDETGVDIQDIEGFLREAWRKRMVGAN